MALHLWNYFNPDNLQEKERNYNDFERNVIAEKDQVAPKVTLLRLDGNHDKQQKAADVLTDLTDYARQIRYRRQSRGVLRFEEILARYSFDDNEVLVTKASAHDGNVEEKTDQLTVDLYKLIDTISWARTRFQADSRTATVNSTIYALFSLYAANESRVERTLRRARATGEDTRAPQPKQRKSKQRTAGSKLDDEDRVALDALRVQKGRIVARPNTLAPKVTLKHIAHLNAASTHSIAVLLTECVTAVEEHYFPALPNSERANQACVRALGDILPPVGDGSESQPQISLAKLNACDNDSHNELVLDLVRLHRYIRDVQAQDVRDPILQDKIKVFETLLDSYGHYYRLQRVVVNSVTLQDEIGAAASHTRKSNTDTRQDTLEAVSDQAPSRPATSAAAGAVPRTQQSEGPADTPRPSVRLPGPDTQGRGLSRTYEEIGEDRRDRMSRQQVPTTPPRGFRDRTPDGWDEFDLGASRLSRRENRDDAAGGARQPSRSRVTENPWDSRSARHGEFRPHFWHREHTDDWLQHEDQPRRPPKPENRFRDRTPERRPPRSPDPFSPFRSRPPPRSFPPRKPQLSIPLFKDAIDAKSFVYDFDNCMAVFECTVQEKIMYLKDAVKGSEAQPWLREFLTQRGPTPDWDILADAFKAEFSHPSDRKAARARLEDRVMTKPETVRAYIMAKKDLIAQFDKNLCEEDRLEYIINGLPIEYQKELISVDHKSVRALTDFLVSYETKLADLKRRIPSLATEKPQPHVTILEASPRATEPASVSAISAQDEILSALKDLAVTSSAQAKMIESIARPSRRDSRDRERRPDSRGGTPYRNASSNDRSRDSSWRDASRDRRGGYDRRDSSRDRRGDYDRRDSSRDRHRDYGRRDSSRDRRRDYDRRDSSRDRRGNYDRRDSSRDRRGDYDRRDSSRNGRGNSDRRDSSRDRRDSRPSGSKDREGNARDRSHSKDRDRSKSRDRSDYHRSDSKNGRR